MRLLRRFTLPALLLFWVALVQAQSTPAPAQLTFTTIDVPGAELTSVYGINSAGDMVGTYSEPGNSQSRGFLFSNGNFTLFDYPGGNDTVPIGINDSGIISGSAYVQNYSSIVSFLYDGNSFTTIQAPDKSVTDAQGINNSGVIVGGYGSLGTTKGFVSTGSRFKTISPPGNYIFIFANGINNFGQIVGTGDDTGFFYSSGQFKTLAVPQAYKTQPWGINDNGIIVGWCMGNALPVRFTGLHSGMGSTFQSAIPVRWKQSSLASTTWDKLLALTLSINRLSTDLSQVPYRLPDF